MEAAESEIEERKSHTQSEKRKTNKLPWTHLIKIKQESKMTK